MAASSIMFLTASLFMVVGNGFTQEPFVMAFAAVKKHELREMEGVAIDANTREAFDEENANFVRPVKPLFVKRELAEYIPPLRVCLWVVNVCVDMKCGALTSSDCDVLQSGLNCSGSGRGSFELVSHSGKLLYKADAQLSRVEKCFRPKTSVSCEFAGGDAGWLFTGHAIKIRFGKQNATVGCRAVSKAEEKSSAMVSEEDSLNYRFFCVNSEQALKVSAFGCIANGLYNEKSQECRTNANEASNWASNVIRNVKSDYDRLQADMPSLPAQLEHIGTTLRSGSNDMRSGSSVADTTAA